jgi:exopolysaccharide biosynthesis polyprenyl glycosylphosphotransferase
MEAIHDPVAEELPGLAWERCEASSRPLLLRGLAFDLARGAMRWSIGVWGTLDVLFCFGSFILAHYLSPRFDFQEPQTYNIGTVATVFAVAMLCCNYALGLYDRHNLAAIGRIVRYAVMASILALALTSVTVAWLGFARIGRVVLFDAFLLTVCGMVLCRLVARSMARRAKIRIMFVGQRRRFRTLERELRRLYPGFYHRPIYIEVPSGDSADRERALRRSVHKHGPDKIIAEDNNSIILDLLHESSEILSSGCEIRSHSAYFEELLGQIPVDTIDDRGLLGGGFTIARQGRNLLKRLFDIAMASVGLLFGVPLILACAMLVKLTSRGPVIYKQVRVGRYGRHFNLYKVRSMRIDAEENGAVWARTGDDRTTWIGRIMRKSRLDELPQLWNILRGDMSFVGPRPERPEFVESLRKEIQHYDLRHLVPPGLTGWAQVRYRYGASVEDARRKLAYDLYYLRHYGPLFDLAICLRTAVAMAKGAR